jgi:hypothetical protein
MMQSINLILVGAIALASFSIGLFFLRFWRSSGDRFFLFFAASFLLEGVNRILLGVSAGLDENAADYYLIRLAAYCLIIVAVFDKNLNRDHDK